MYDKLVPATCPVCVASMAQLAGTRRRLPSDEVDFLQGDERKRPDELQSRLTDCARNTLCEEALPCFFSF